MSIESVEDLERWLRDKAAEATENCRRARMLDDTYLLTQWTAMHIAFQEVLEVTGTINQVGFGVDVASRCEDCGMRDARLCEPCAIDV